MRLNDMQLQFKDNILKPDLLEQHQDFAALFVNDEIALNERLAVYRHNVFQSLHNVLADVYPLVEKLVGEQFLADMVREYISKNLPEVACLNSYGVTFPDFIEQFTPAKTLPYLVDVARMEWALNEADHAKDDEALDVMELRNMAPDRLENLVFFFRESVRFIDSNFPLFEVREFCLQDRPEGELDIDQGGAKLMVFRPSLGVQMVKLEPDEYKFLTLLQEGKTIGNVSKTILQDNPDYNIEQNLQKHFTLGSFSSFSSFKIMPG